MEGDWNTGGVCALDKPLANEFTSKQTLEFNQLLRVEVKPYVDRETNGKWKKKATHLLLDVQGLSDLRPDAKPARRIVGKPNDCTHWCLPGVPDLWNVLLLNQLCKRVSNGSERH